MKNMSIFNHWLAVANTNVKIMIQNHMFIVFTSISEHHHLKQTT